MNVGAAATARRGKSHATAQNEGLATPFHSTYPLFILNHGIPATAPIPKAEISDAPQLQKLVRNVILARHDCHAIWFIVLRELFLDSSSFQSIPVMMSFSMLFVSLALWMVSFCGVVIAAPNYYEMPALVPAYSHGQVATHTTTETSPTTYWTHASK